MLNILYLVLVISIAFVAFATGFRKGFTSMIAQVLGFAFGAVAARILTPEYSDSFQWITSYSPDDDFNDLAQNIVCASTIYFIVYCLFALATPILRGALSIIRIGMFNRLTGAFFNLIKNLLWLSICLNLLICFSTRSELLKYEQANDGNLISAVMELTPSILGCYGAEDFAHLHQLKEAKSIS